MCIYVCMCMYAYIFIYIPVDILVQLEAINLKLSLKFREFEAIMAASGEQFEAMATNLQALADLLQAILQKDSYMEKRGNFQGHDAELVFLREIVEQLARCSAVKMQKSHAFDVKMAMLEPVLENEAQLEFALKTQKLTKKDLTAAVERMKLLHKLQLTETNRIGMEKPGDLCSTLKSCSWVYIYIYQ